MMFLSSQLSAAEVTDWCGQQVLSHGNFNIWSLHKETHSPAALNNFNGNQRETRKVSLYNPLKYNQ